MTFSRLLLSCAFALTACLYPIVAAPAQADPPPDAVVVDLPDGWSLMSTQTGMQLAWESLRRLPWSDATLEVRAGERPLAPATLLPDQRTVTAPIRSDQLLGLTEGGADALAVWSGGRPVADAPTDALTVAPSAPQREAAPDVRVISPASDPGRPGRFDVEVSHYRGTGATVPGYPVPIEVLGQVVAPVGAPGPRPMVVLMHGRHEPCYRTRTGRLTVAWPCPAGTEAVPSHRGYTYLQRHLASRGYLTVSIAVNGINAQDAFVDDGGAAARSILVRHHLRMWARWAEPGGRWEGSVDLQRVLLVGHSRGGEGVQRAAIDSAPSAPWDIAGTVVLAPTAFLRQTPAFTPTTAMLPTCDGDVVAFEGQVYVDRPRDVTPDPALRSAVTLVGANHNFFNTEWTPGLAVADATDDAMWRPECRAQSDARMSAAEQRQVAKTYVTATAQTVLDGDPVSSRLLDGSRVVARSTRGLDVRVAALGARRATVRPGLDGRVVGSGGASLCVGRTGGGNPQLCGRRRDPNLTPHWPSTWAGSAVPTAPAMQLQWSNGHGRALLRLDAPFDLSTHRAVEARVAVDPRGGAARLALRLVDGADRVLTLDAPRLQPLPGGGNGGQVWGQTLRARLPDTGRFDASDVRALGVVALAGHGRLWMIDASGFTPGLASLPDARPPRLDVRTVETPEGDVDGTARLPLVLDAPGDQVAIVSLEVLSPDGVSTVERVRFEPGDTREVLRFPFEGDTRDDFDRKAWTAHAYAVRDVVVRAAVGSAVVVDDDPTPTVTVAPIDDDVVEGAALRWQVELSDGVDYGLMLAASAVPDGAGRPELATDDVPRRWLRRQAPVPDAPVPLHEIDLQVVLYFPEQYTTATLRIPTVTDTLTEGAEWLTLEVRDELGNPVVSPFSGRVTES